MIWSQVAAISQHPLPPKQAGRPPRTSNRSVFLADVMTDTLQQKAICFRLRLPIWKAAVKNGTDVRSLLDFALRGRGPTLASLNLALCMAFVLFNFWQS